KADTPLVPHLVRLMRGEDLSAQQASAFFKEMMSANANPAQMSGALTALTAKGETFEELAGMANAMLLAAIKVKSPKNAVDITGTGSSLAKTFNVSTAAALVASGAGLTVAKQSNPGVATKAGSSDVLSELGIKPSNEPNGAQATLRGTGLCFLFAPKFHPELRRIGDIRRTLGIRTCLNLLALLANPADVSRHLIGVWHRSLVEPMARALSLLGAEMAWVVYGEDGLDEVTLSGKTFVGVVKGPKVKVYTVTPTDFGLKTARIDRLRTESAKASAEIIREVLASRRRDEARSLIVLNAAAALYIGGVAKDPMHAARLAEQSIDSGMAQNKLERLIQVTGKSRS
ncbi:MAG: anthranilate phosphoribosyltransferase, partial [Pyrinomonadaceae bacterium]